jgi:hypothetical protein
LYGAGQADCHGALVVTAPLAADLAGLAGRAAAGTDASATASSTTFRIAATYPNRALGSNSSPRRNRA